MTATAAVATSPYVSYDLVSLNFHTTTWVATVVLAVYCLWLTWEPPVRQFAFVTVLVTALAGTTLRRRSVVRIRRAHPLRVDGRAARDLPAVSFGRRGRRRGRLCGAADRVGDDVGDASR